jgi:hypothetical protein
LQRGSGGGGNRHRRSMKRRQQAPLRGSDGQRQTRGARHPSPSARSRGPAARHREGRRAGRRRPAWRRCGAGVAAHGNRRSVGRRRHPVSNPTSNPGRSTRIPRFPWNRPPRQMGCVRYGPLRLPFHRKEDPRPLLETTGTGGTGLALRCAPLVSWSEPSGDYPLPPVPEAVNVEG